MKNGICGAAVLNIDTVSISAGLQSLFTCFVVNCLFSSVR